MQRSKETWFLLWIVLEYNRK